MRTIRFSFILASKLYKLQFWALEWAWRAAETNLRCVRNSGTCSVKSQ